MEISQVELVSNASKFLDKYYRILHQSPSQAYRFYQKSSMLVHPDVNGMISIATNLQEINEKLMAMDASNYTRKIETMGALPFFSKGVLVVVTGYLTSPDRIRWSFDESFFLVPQENDGFLISHDILHIESVGCPAVLPPDSIPCKFVDEYYTTLRQSPGQACRFYHELSKISRLDVNGIMTYGTNLQEINQMMMAMEASDNYFWEKETVDALPLFGNAFLISVTGYLIGPGSIRRSFVQDFILAPLGPPNNYFIFNDILCISVDCPAVVLSGNLGLVMANGSIRAPANGNVPILSSDVVYLQTNGAGSGGTTRASLTTRPGVPDAFPLLGAVNGSGGKMKGASTCFICVVEPVDGACVPCGHVGCMECLSKIKELTGTCPICRARIKQLLKLYGASIMAAEGVPDAFPLLGSANGSSGRMEGASACFICEEAPVDGACVPCGHVGCMECLSKIKEQMGTCPICRARIKRLLKLHFE